MKYEVILVLPKNKEVLEKKFTEAMVDVCMERLSKDEVEFLIERLSDQVKSK